MRFPLLCLFAFLLIGPVRAAEPFFKKGDVIALVGGEDMVVASEYGYLELLLTRALPDYHLRFRNLAWEGDTVFEQRRDLNFPTYEEQLDKIGATVVIAQFGQWEYLAGREKLPEFKTALETLLRRFQGEGKKRKVILFGSTGWRTKVASDLEILDTVEYAYWEGMGEVGNRLGIFVQAPRIAPHPHGPVFRDGFHLTAIGQMLFAGSLSGGIALYPQDIPHPLTLRSSFPVPIYQDPLNERLRQLIIAKNRLWFDYWRPQNWAFLAGDRTAQPSSRDHLDPSKRWFPPEREAFLPLIEAKEKEIDALAAQLAGKP